MIQFDIKVPPQKKKKKKKKQTNKHKQPRLTIQMKENVKSVALH